VGVVQAETRKAMKIRQQQQHRRKHAHDQEYEQDLTARPEAVARQAVVTADADRQAPPPVSTVTTALLKNIVPGTPLTHSVA